MKTEGANNNNNNNKQQIFTIRIIWCALLISLFVLLFVAHNPKSSEVVDTAMTTHLSSIFPWIAGGLLLLSILISKLFSSQPHRAKTEQHAAKPPLPQLLQIMLVRMALHEAVAILGFILVQLSKNPEAMHPYLFAAVLANLLVFPKTAAFTQ